MFRYFSCPNCGILIDVQEMNCKIFRCGIYKKDGKQIDPHLNEEECKRLKGFIWGCGKPFCYSDEKRSMVVCEYI